MYLYLSNLIKYIVVISCFKIDIILKLLIDCRSLFILLDYKIKQKLIKLYTYNLF